MLRAKALAAEDLHLFRRHSASHPCIDCAERSLDLPSWNDVSDVHVAVGAQHGFLVRRQLHGGMLIEAFRSHSLTLRRMVTPLQSPQLTVKYFLSDPIGVDLEELLPVFHKLIQKNALGHELMIDVASYAHVHHGPGVLLICNTAHYAVDTRHGRPGVLFAKKREAHGSVSVRLREAFRSVLMFADLLASEV